MVEGYPSGGFQSIPDLLTASRTNAVRNKNILVKGQVIGVDPGGLFPLIPAMTFNFMAPGTGGHDRVHHDHVW